MGRGTSKSFVVFAPATAEPSAEPWYVGTLDASGRARIESAAGIESVGTALRQLGYRSAHPVLLALPSTWCYCATLSTAGLSRGARRQAMLFRLEEKLPLAAEELVADYIHFASDSALGVCALVASVRPIVDALERVGVAVESISPAVLLAASATRGNEDRRQAGANGILWQSDGHLELILFSSVGKASAWSTLPATAADLLLHLRLTTLDRTRRLRLQCFDVESALAETARSVTNVELLDDVTQRPIAQSVVAAAAAAREGRLELPVNLRRDALASSDRYRQLRRPLIAAVAAILALLICACAAMLWRAQRYDQLAANAAERQRSVFRQVFPAQAQQQEVGLVKARLLSERRKLRGLSGAGSGDSPNVGASALIMLHEALSRLPADLRYRVLEMRFGPGERLYLEGQARTHGDADAIATALRKANGFTVEPPRTEQLKDKGVSFTLGGALVTAAPRTANGTSIPTTAPTRADAAMTRSAP